MSGPEKEKHKLGILKKWAQSFYHKWGPSSITIRVHRPYVMPSWWQYASASIRASWATLVGICKNPLKGKSNGIDRWLDQFSHSNDEHSWRIHNARKKPW